MRLIPVSALALVAALAVSAGLGPVPSASAQAGVSLANAQGTRTIDPAYATTLTVRGTGFQSVKGGHGGIYVFFGTVKPGWRPSQGGVTGRDYLYVPDSEAANNRGFQRYVAFPGSDTAGSANGGVMNAAGGWSAQIVVPGATFRAADRDGKVTTVDCRKVTCGVITVGAHGIDNAHNETFTPVQVAATSTGTSTGTTPAPGSETGTETGPAPETATGAETPTAGSSAPVKAIGKPRLRVDRRSARAGHVLPFAAQGLTPGAQVSVVYDDGAAGAGPFLVGADGRVSGVVTLPAETGGGTHELRVFGVERAPAVSFAVIAADPPAAVAQVSTDSSERRAAIVFTAVAALLVLLALVRLGLGHRARARRLADAS